MYKAGLADLTAPGMRGTALGIQSAAGFLCTVISPVVFGRLVEAGNGSGWGTAFLSLALGAMIAPLAVSFLPDGRMGKKSGGSVVKAGRKSAAAAPVRHQGVPDRRDAGRRGELGVTEIDGRLGIDKSTAYRILATLREMGYVRQNP